MTIAHQSESEITFNSGDTIASRLAETNQPYHENPGSAEPLIHNMLDDYLTVSKVRDTLDDRREQVDAYLQKRRETIIKYVEDSIEENALDIDDALVGTETMSNAAYAELYFDQVLSELQGDRVKLERAEQAPQAENPGHITISEQTEDDLAANSAYIDVIVGGGLELSKKAMKKIGKLAMAISGAILLPPLKEEFHDDLHLLDDPEHAAEVTQVIDLRTIKPKDNI